MLRGVINCSSDPTRTITAVRRLEQLRSPGRLLQLDGLAIGTSARNVGAAQVDGLHCLIDGRISLSPSVPFASAREQLAEAVVRAYRVKGDSLLRDLRGSFSLVLWDQARGRGLLSCDLLATRQLFMWQGDGYLLFATELHELLELIPTRPAPDQRAFVSWLVGGSCPLGCTLYEGVSRLSPGQLVEVDGRSSKLRTYWHPEYVGTLSGSRAEMAGLLRDELEQATVRPLSPTANAVILSGGLDSSIVTMFAARNNPPGSVLRTYSAVFPGREFDETDKVVALTSALGVEPGTFDLRPQGTVRLAVEYTARWKVPLPGAGALVDMAMVAEAAGDGAEVVLDGQTGDEVLGFAPYLVADRLRAGRLLAAVKLARRWPLGRGTTRRDKIWILKNLGIKAMVPAAVAQYLGARSGGTSGPTWLLPETKRTYAELADDWAWKKTMHDGPLWWRHLADVLVNAPHRELRLDYLRHRAESVGLMNASPLYDFDLINLCMRLRPELAFDSRFTRPLAREALHGLIPDAVRLQTQKAVFTPFVSEAITGADAPWIGRLLDGPDPELGAYVDVDHARRIWRGADPQLPLGSMAWGTTVWRLAAAEAWLQLQTREDELYELLEDTSLPGVSASRSGSSTALFSD